MTQELEVTIKGTKPLLQRSAASMMVVDSKSRKVKSSNYNVSEEAELCLYKDARGTKCIPFMHILSSMRKAAVNLKKGGAGKNTLKDFVFSGLAIKESLIPLTNQNHAVDIQVVRGLVGYGKMWFGMVWHGLVGCGMVTLSSRKGV